MSKSISLIVRASQCLFLHHIHIYGSLFGLGLPLALLHSSLGLLRGFSFCGREFLAEGGLGPTPEHWLKEWPRILLREKSGSVSVKEADGREGFGVATYSSMQGGQNLPLPREEGPWSGSLTSALQVLSLD